MKNPQSCVFAIEVKSRPGKVSRGGVRPRGLPVPAGRLGYSAERPHGPDARHRSAVYGALPTEDCRIRQPRPQAESVRVAGVADKVVTLEVADKIRIKVSKTSVLGYSQAPGEAATGS